MDRIYIAPKKSIGIDAGVDAAFFDVADAYSPTLDVTELLKTRVYEGNGEERVTRVKCRDLMEAAYGMFPGASVELLGSFDDVLIVAERKRASSSGPLKLAANFAIYLLLFLGSALSVMYFHIDVGMLDTQREFARALGNGGDAGLRIIAVAYSIGLMLGMLLFFRNRKVAGRKVPSPIDLKMESYNSGVVGYLLRRLAKEEGK
jgi:stage V sporulation protein AA